MTYRYTPKRTSITTLIQYAGKPDSIEVLDCGKKIGERVALIYTEMPCYHTKPRKARPRKKQLTAYERKIIELLAQGMTHTEIGTALHYSRGTIVRYCKDITRKLGATNIRNAIYLAYRKRKYQRVFGNMTIQDDT